MRHVGSACVVTISTALVAVLGIMIVLISVLALVVVNWLRRR